MDAETVVGVIPNARMKTGLFSTATYTLVVTDRRLLFAEQTNEVAKRRAAEAKDAAKAAGKGFMPSGRPRPARASTTAATTWR
jgi:hypothetical protein